MRRRLAAALAVTTLAAPVGVAVAGGASAAGSPPPDPGATRVAVCGPASPDTARCHAWRLVGPDRRRGTTTTSSTTSSSTTTSSTTTSSTTSTTLAAAPGGFGPGDLRSAYGLPSTTAGAGQTVAIVDAYDDPSAESDLGVYRAQFGLPPCTTANGCFHKVNQSGGTTYPGTNGGWAQEISLDVDMASAICQNCGILLVEANTASFADLGAAENWAAAHASVVSNSWGTTEFSGETSYDGYFDHPGVPITFSSGDSGYGVQYPAASPYVTAVGGTSLTHSTSARGWAESAWSGAGSGCSTQEPKPSWQTDAGCARRTVADVSAVADPNTGVAVYDSFAYQGASGWLVFGGTSVAAPIVASVYALAGNGTSVTAASFAYSNLGSLFDVTSGSNGSCGSSYLCTAVSGYDGPTGLGTPHGSGAF